MKIGIITFWQTRDNYGQMLQCFALQTALKQLGHEPFLIRYAHTEHTYSFKEKSRHFVVNLLKCRFSKLTLKQKILGPLSDTEKQRDFESFKNIYINKTEQIYYSLGELKKNPPEADCYIVGSDQVWARGLESDDGRVFMLDFVSDKKRKLSYAASFGSSSKPQYYLNKLPEYLKSFSDISVREESGLTICRQVGINANLVLDPTLLLLADSYKSMFDLRDKKEENQIFIYSLNITDAEEIGWSKLKKIMKKDNARVLITPASGYISGSELFGRDVEYQYCKIAEWLNNINESNLVITTSFHGVMFCLQFHTPFVYVPLKGKFSNGNNRVQDFIKYLNVEVPCYSDDFDYSTIGNLEWNWNDIDMKINNLRNESLRFLVNALR